MLAAAGGWRVLARPGGQDPSCAAASALLSGRFSFFGLAGSLRKPVGPKIAETPPWGAIYSVTGTTWTLDC